MQLFLYSTSLYQVQDTSSNQIDSNPQGLLVVFSIMSFWHHMVQVSCGLVNGMEDKIKFWVRELYNSNIFYQHLLFCVFIVNWEWNTNAGVFILFHSHLWYIIFSFFIVVGSLAGTNLIDNNVRSMLCFNKSHHLT